VFKYEEMTSVGRAVGRAIDERPKGQGFESGCCWYRVKIEEIFLKNRINLMSLSYTLSYFG
jgi:hypothetical protein